MTEKTIRKQDTMEMDEETVKSQAEEKLLIQTNDQTLSENDKSSGPPGVIPNSKTQKLIQLQSYDRRQTYKQIVKVHEAAEEAKKAYGRRTYVSAEGDPEEYGPSFTRKNDKLINHYTNKVSLQKKYQTGGDTNAAINDSTNDDLSDLDRDEMNGIYGGRQ